MRDLIHLAAHWQLWLAGAAVLGASLGAVIAGWALGGP